MVEAGAALAASTSPALPSSCSPGPALAPSEPASGGRPANETPVTVLQRMALQHFLDEEEQAGLPDDDGDGGGRDEAESEDDGGIEPALRAAAIGTSGALVVGGIGDAIEAGSPAGQVARVNQNAGAGGGQLADANEQATEAGAAGAAHGFREARARAVEPVYRFSPPPTARQMKDNADKFCSTFMEGIVRTWPQAPVTALSKKAHAEGQTCSGILLGLKGTSVETKTWALRIAVAMRFANFVGRTVCIPVNAPRPADEELDRGVAKFFACLNIRTQEVINCFLDARRRALPVAGGGAKILERTVKGYSAAVSFLFTNARLNGVTGPKLVADCDGARSPWQKKGEMEKAAERKNVREDPGDYVGNPMDAETIKDHKSAAEKEARREGQHNKTSADVTPEMLSLLYDSLVRAHISSSSTVTAPSTSGAQPGGTVVANSAAHPTPPTAATLLASCPPVAGVGTSNVSTRQTDFLAYVFYAFLFETLARPWTLINLKYKDVTLPDLLVASNEQFQNL